MKRESHNNRRKIYALTLVASAVTIALQSSAAMHYVSQTSPSPTPPYSTPDTAAHTIQDAVDAASDGDTVSVAPDQYYLTNQVTVTKAIVLKAPSGPDHTFLDNTNATWTLWVSNSLAVADGFTLRNPLLAVNKEPSGALLVGGTIQNCNFTNFRAVAVGTVVTMNGGILSNSIVTYSRQFGDSAVFSSGGGLITHCRILGSSGGPSGSGVHLENSRLENSVIGGAGGSVGHSGGQAVYALSSTIVACSISDNNSTDDGGGVYLNASIMERCFVTHNASISGAGVFETNSVIRNSLIVSNNAVVLGPETGVGGHGGGVYMQGGALVNCTVVGNTAANCPSDPGTGGGIYIEWGSVTNSVIQYNILGGCSAETNNWFNAGPGIFDHCCIIPDPGGAGNITQDPQSVDFTSGNFHLAATSPCIGAGIVQPWMTGAQDLDGNPRTTNGRVDLGAYQNQSPFPLILSITRSGSNIVLRWPTAGTSDLVLQQSSDLTAPESWTPTEAIVGDDGTNKFVTIPAINSVEFFRLRNP